MGSERRPCGDWVRRVFEFTPTVDSEKVSSDRRRFSAWMVFDIKSSEVYIGGTPRAP
jgi:hypothetical protein